MRDLSRFGRSPRGSSTAIKANGRNRRKSPYPGRMRSAAEERKVVTVLFSDLVDSTDRADRRDPEDVRATLVPFYRLLREELERFGGTVEKFIGDAVMALFGAPVSHEDDAERAVRAALGIRRAIERLNEERG